MQWSGFTSGGDEPAEFRASREEEGRAPMLTLLQILDMPHATIDTGDGLRYVWPAAFAHDGPWKTTPEADKEALRILYDDEGFAAFAQWGGYIGYRVGITEDGDWSSFVEGD